MSRLNSVLDSRSFLWTALFLGWVGVVHAHPVSLTDAVLDVREDSSRFKLSITVEDLVLYYELKANKEFRFEESEIKKAARHNKHGQRRFALLQRAGRCIDFGMPIGRIKCRKQWLPLLLLLLLGAAAAAECRCCWVPLLLLSAVAATCGYCSEAVAGCRCCC